MPTLLSRINQRKKHIILVIIFILLCILNIFLLLKLLSPQITIINQSKTYNVEFKPTKKFSEVIKSWGLWNKNVIYYRDSNFTTVNKLKIIFTDEKHDYYLVEKDSSGQVLWSATSTLEGAHTLVFIIKLEPSILKNLDDESDKNRIIDKKINSIVLTTAYFITHPSDFMNSKNVKRPYLDNYFDVFDQHPEYIPFYTHQLL